MGKKRLRKSKTSKGLRSNVRHGLVQAVASAKDVVAVATDKVEAWSKGLNPWLTVENPNKGATNMKFIRVRANDWYGPWKFTPKEVKE